MIGSGDAGRSFDRHLLAAGLWWGCVGGALELSARSLAWVIRPHVTVEQIRINHHHLWMVPASNVVVLGAVGLALAIIARFLSAARRVAVPVFASLAFFGAIKTVPQLHRASATVLAIGLGMLVMRCLAAREPGYRRTIRWTLAPLLVLLIASAWFQAGRVVNSERRALESLPSAKAGAPNVLLIVMDNVRVDDMSLYGYARETTPNLTHLARQGIRFDRARSSASWTLPSHASMLTGRWPHELSVTVDTPLDSSCETLAEALAKRGYVTAGFVGNTYYCNAWYGLDRGFSRYQDFAANTEVSLVETLRSGALGRVAIDTLNLGVKEMPGDPRTRKTAAKINADLLGWLEARDSDRPFFAFLNYYDAHEPFHPPAESPRRFGLSARPEAERNAIMREFSQLAKRGIGLTSPQAATTIHRAAELLRDSYDDCITSLDDRIGDLMDELERRDLLDDTLVILTSDHGEEFNEKSLFGHGLSVYRPEVHVPLVVIPPRRSDAARGRVITSPASLRDIPATVMGYVEPGRSSFAGASLARFWNDADAESGTVLSEIEHQRKFARNPQIPASLGPVTAITEGRFVYIRNHDGREEVYDHQTDPGETRNLALDRGNEALLITLREAFEQVDSGPEAERSAASIADRDAERRAVR